MKALFLSTAAAGLLLSSAASAQSLTTQERVNARQVIAEQGVFLNGKNVYADYGWSNGQRVSVSAISRTTFKTSDGKIVSGEAVANELGRALSGGAMTGTPGSDN